MKVPCILGDSYASSKKFWKKIKGLNGLKSFGLDEQYLSLKTWLVVAIQVWLEVRGSRNLQSIISFIQ